MKVLFVGMGSIGQRHLRNITSLLKSEPHHLMTCRKTASQLVIEDGSVRKIHSLSDYYGFIEYQDLETALAKEPDVTFICLPSSLHLETATRAAMAGSHLFVEKPLATATKDLDQLESLVQKKNLIAMVGFQSRFHPYVQKIYSIIQHRIYGEIVSARFNWSTYLPAHHPYEDYRYGYAAMKNLGGGVTFCLSHELDLIQHFFGLPRDVYAIGGNLSRLEMDAEDSISALYRFSGPKGAYPVQLQLSFAQGPERRRFELLMEDAYLECDLYRHSLKVILHSNEVVVHEEMPEFVRNELFLSEIRHFLTCIYSGIETDIPLSEGRKSVEMALAIHQSIRSGNVVHF